MSIKFISHLPIVTHFLMVYLFFSPTMVNGHGVQLGVNNSDFQLYEEFIKSSEKEVEDITDFSSPMLNRSVVSLILLQKAVRLGGYNNPIAVSGVPNSLRNFQMTKQGVFIALGHDVWKEAAESNSEDLYISSEIIENGVFEKGIYGVQSNKELFSITSLDDLQKCCSILENPTWVVDHKTINEMKIETVYETYKFESMIKMVHAGRADFALLEFSKHPELKIEKFGVTLDAVPGYKVAMRSSRHYAVSQKHPDGEVFFKALQRGISILKEQDLFTKAFREVGFINPAVEDWKVINQP